MDDLKYLQPGFNPANLRVVDLRRVLLFHEVPFPSAARKATLVDIFRTYISPRAGELLASLSVGGGDVPAIVDANITSAQVTQPRKISSTTTPRKRQQSPVEAVPKHEDLDNTEAGRLKAEEEGSPFSAQNPFQSPRVETKTPSRARKSSQIVKARSPKTHSSPMSSTGYEPSKESLATSPANFSSDMFALDSMQYPEPSEEDFAASYEDVSVAGSDSVEDDEEYYEESVDEDEESVDEDEEADEEDDEEVDEEEEEEFDVSLLDGSRDAPPFQFPFAIFGVWIIFLLTSVSIWWWKSERLRTGYCEIEGQGVQLGGDYDSTNLLSYFELDCLPCPEHAKCYSDLRVECEPDYIFVRSPLSLGGFLPIAPKCVPDSGKLEKARQLLDVELLLLRKRLAEVECSGVAKDKNDATISVEELKSTLSAMKSSKIPNGVFEELWNISYKDLTLQDEVYVVSEEFGDRVGSKSEEEFPWTCVLKLELREFLKANRLKITRKAFF
ncbi:Man1-Src1p-C-terminal domain-containing protein [Myxozyma melibiosi]|uniref:Man1-Src1p-C-terminal domain-containing protein n=1 Tax=Myxozyma melibiosi TaxID=54550 RepID=A0ABR1F4X1_9ASCO